MSKKRAAPCLEVLDGGVVIVEGWVINMEYDDDVLDVDDDKNRTVWLLVVLFIELLVKKFGDNNNDCDNKDVEEDDEDNRVDCDDDLISLS